MPFSILNASTCAALIARWASSTAVSNPKDLSMTGISLSIVLGIPATETLRPRFLTSYRISAAPLCVPSPPII
nr:hypothetical protein Iba_chr11bCG12430 [Ipomoea batatas]